MCSQKLLPLERFYAPERGWRMDGVVGCAHIHDTATDRGGGRERSRSLAQDVRAAFAHPSLTSRKENYRVGKRWGQAKQPRDRTPQPKCSSDSTLSVLRESVASGSAVPYARNPAVLDSVNLCSSPPPIKSRKDRWGRIPTILASQTRGLLPSAPQRTSPSEA